jgi:hypothetical protein
VAKCTTCQLKLNLARTRKLELTAQMPRRRWTSTEQLDWLQPWVPTFTDAQESKNFSSFFGELYKAWFEKYPLDKLKTQEKGEKIKGLEEAEAAGNTEKAEKIREGWWEQASVHVTACSSSMTISFRDYTTGSIIIHEQGVLLTINGKF